MASVSWLTISEMPTMLRFLSRFDRALSLLSVTAHSRSHAQRRPRGALNLGCTIQARIKRLTDRDAFDLEQPLQRLRRTIDLYRPLVAPSLQLASVRRPMLFVGNGKLGQ